MLVHAEVVRGGRVSRVVRGEVALWVDFDGGNGEDVRVVFGQGGSCGRVISPLEVS